MANAGRMLDLDPEAMDLTNFPASNKSEAYRNRHLHKIAQSVNRSQEALFRRHPAIKHRMWSLYDRVNHAPTSEVLSSASRARPVGFYDPYTKDLRRQLMAMSFPTEAMPAWLTGDMSTDQAAI